jgi:membrane-associated phospholipid phosphatase
VSRVVGRLTAADLLLLSALAVLAGLTLASPAPVAGSGRLLALDALGAAAILALAVVRGDRSTGPLSAIHDWYPAPVIFLVFKHVDPVLRAWRPVDRDAWLIAADRWLFGGDVGAWVSGLARPAAVEALQIAYTSFYVLFLVVGYELYRRRPREVYRVFVFGCAYGFFLTYAAYAAVPAVGPRFTLHDFAGLERELPGLWLTPALRAFVNAGGSIPAGASSSLAAATVQRDVFPSGHTAMTVALVAWAWRARLRVAPGITAVGVLVVAGALLLRYHYAVDILVGALCGAAIAVTAAPAHRALVGLLPLRDRLERLAEAGRC